MDSAILVRLSGGRQIILNENQIASISQKDNKDIAIIRMSNGDELEVTDPPYTSWRYDTLIPN